MMMVKILLICVVLCAVLDLIQSERGRCKTCRFIPYKRIKRGKYSGPPKRFYSRPPVSFPYLGAVSYTPPPNFISEDDQPYPGPPSSYKVSKRPSNDGLADKDINNILKHLTKQDLDKMIEFANEKQKEAIPYPNNLDTFSNQYNTDLKKREEIDVYKANNDDFTAFEKFEKDISTPQNEIKNKYTDSIRPVESEQKYNFKGPYVDQKPSDNYASNEPANYVVQPSNTIKEFKIQENILHSNIQQEYLNVNKNVDQINNVASESNTDEYLPKPLNLRQDDYVASYTNNIPKVVKAEANAYKVEDFGDLPLMNYNSKLDTVSSYHVPHYTITTPTKYQAPASSVKAPPVEPAPPVLEAQKQSDAHLKAVKIWSHRSKGTAYYLHDDGTLSLELPTRAKGSYGYH